MVLASGPRARAERRQKRTSRGPCGASPAPRADTWGLLPRQCERPHHSRQGGSGPRQAHRGPRLERFIRSGRSVHARSFLPIRTSHARLCLLFPRGSGLENSGPSPRPAAEVPGIIHDSPARHWQVHRPLSALMKQHRGSSTRPPVAQQPACRGSDSMGRQCWCRQGPRPLHRAQTAPRSSVSPRLLGPGGPSHSLNMCACLLCTREATSLTISGEMNTTVQLVIRMKK